MRAMGFRGGVSLREIPHEGKEKTAGKDPVSFIPETVALSMQQHIGAPCVPLVAVGEYVALGQKIAEAETLISAPVHASVSGRVLAIESRPMANGVEQVHVVLENDGLDRRAEGQETGTMAQDLRADQIRAQIREAGIVGMGGAMFPTAVKMDVKDLPQIQTLIINGAECEPYLTADDCLMRTQSDAIVEGALLLQKACGANELIIAIEDNKAAAQRKMKTACIPYAHVRVEELATRYPQGGEKQLIESVCGMEVPEGKLPGSIGVLVSNVATAHAVWNAVNQKTPSILRLCTVTGDVAEPQNVWIRVGTSVAELLDFCGGFDGEPAKVVIGGPMMGQALQRLDVALTKGSNGIWVVNEENACAQREDACIRCARCVQACPMSLMPHSLNQFYLVQDWQKCKALHAQSCINCGCCSYVCPAKRRLAETITAASRVIATWKEG